MGAVIRWTNLDNPPHDATLLNGACGTPTLETGDSGSLRFLVPGTYEYFCTIHPNMRGTIVVTG